MTIRIDEIYGPVITFSDGRIEYLYREYVQYLLESHWDKVAKKRGITGPPTDL